jgi:PhnB protein
MATAIPHNYGTVTTYLHVRGAAKAIEFYQQAFGATETMRLTMGEMIGHAELKFGSTVLMLAEENPNWGNKGPETLGGCSAGLCIYSDDCDAMYARAIAAGATALQPVTDQFYGDRMGAVLDPFGHKWSIATHQEDVPHSEMQRRMDDFMKSQQ